MRVLLAVGAAAILAAALFAGRIVLHTFTDHGHLDIFHLAVTAIGLGIAALLAWRAVLHRPAA